MKNRKKISLIVAFFTLITFTLFYNSASIKVKKENKHRAYIAAIVKDGVEKYFEVNHHYPETITDLPLQYKPTIKQFVNGGVLAYTRDKNGTEWFILTCRFAGILPMGNSAYRLSWQGIQYSSDIRRLPYPAGESPNANQQGFYIADFH